MKQNSCEACFSVNFKKTYAISMGVNKRLLKRLKLKWVLLFLSKANWFGKKVFLQESVTYSSHGYLSTSFEEVNIDLWFSVVEKKQDLKFRGKKKLLKFGAKFEEIKSFYFLRNILSVTVFLKACLNGTVMPRKSSWLLPLHWMFF